MRKLISDKKVGIITYQYQHLKTEQVIMNLIIQGCKLKVYALPFIEKKGKEDIFLHIDLIKIKVWIFE